MEPTSSPCAVSALSLATLPADIYLLSVETTAVRNFSVEVSAGLYPNHYDISVEGADFCNVTVGYTHPGHDDLVHVEAWLPLEAEDWNERIQVIGGAGYGSGRFYLSYGGMAGAVSEGYATASTDAGTDDPFSSRWALSSPGVTNDAVVLDWAHLALNDMAVITKAIVKEYYGKPHKHAYFSGCSAGGRQGYMLAQRYPTAFDGIAAAAPALYWDVWTPSMAWGLAVMNDLQVYPPACEIDAITSAAIKMCDALDSVVDGNIGRPKRCTQLFDPFSLVGRKIPCPELGKGKETEITKAAATIVSKTWEGPRTENGSFVWYGPWPGSALSGEYGMDGTDCSSGTCIPVPVGLATEWIGKFAMKDPDASVANITTAEYLSLTAKASAEFGALLGASDPDLSRFRDAGAKLITYHGLMDQIIPEQGTSRYFDAVTSKMKLSVDEVRKFYRYYPVPGMSHCSGGTGGYPTTIFKELVSWVEDGVVPGELPVEFLDPDGKRNERALCAYPDVSVFDAKCGDSTKRQCFRCVDGGAVAVAKR